MNNSIVKSLMAANTSAKATDWVTDHPKESEILRNDYIGMLGMQIQNPAMFGALGGAEQLHILAKKHYGK